MRRGYDNVLDDDSFLAAIAASAHAIHSFEEERRNLKVSRTDRTRKQEPLMKPSKAGSSMRNIKDLSSHGSSFADDRLQRQRGRRSSNDSYDKADAWEMAQIANIRKKYEKMYSDIRAWENDRRSREKRRMEKRKREMEMIMTRNMKHYQSKLIRIDHIASGARTKVAEKQRYEESRAKEKANKMRSTGKTRPVSSWCFCF